MHHPYQRFFEDGNPWKEPIDQHRWERELPGKVSPGEWDRLSADRQPEVREAKTRTTGGPGGLPGSMTIKYRSRIWQDMRIARAVVRAREEAEGEPVKPMDLEADVTAARGPDRCRGTAAGSQAGCRRAALRVRAEARWDMAAGARAEARWDTAAGGAAEFRRDTAVRGRAEFQPDMEVRVRMARCQGPGAVLEVLPLSMEAGARTAKRQGPAAAVLAQLGPDTGIKVMKAAIRRLGGMEIKIRI